MIDWSKHRGVRGITNDLAQVDIAFVGTDDVAEIEIYAEDGQFCRVPAFEVRNGEGGVLMAGVLAPGFTVHYRVTAEEEPDDE